VCVRSNQAHLGTHRFASYDAAVLSSRIILITSAVFALVFGLAMPTFAQAAADDDISMRGQGLILDTDDDLASIHRRSARDAMSRCYEAVPCWIMPTWRVAEQLPATLGAFDLVILDEASQSDVTELPALLRGNKVLIVGDDRQVSPRKFDHDHHGITCQRD
jgi:hypothetical protein